CSSRRRHTRSTRDWSSDVCSSDLALAKGVVERLGLSPHQREVAEFLVEQHLLMSQTAQSRDLSDPHLVGEFAGQVEDVEKLTALDRKSTRLNSSHEWISSAVFGLK